MVPDSLPEPVQVALEVTGILEQLGVPYVVTGSLASSVHGEPRSTNDIDIVANLLPTHVGSLIAALGEQYYVDPDTAAEAVGRGTSFNAVHLGLAIKVDVFVVGNDPLDRERVTHGVPVRLGQGESCTLRVDRAEFTVLRKLEWFRRGGEFSDRQWRDILGILKIQGNRLDRNLLEHWARRLGVEDLLDRARQQAGGEA